MKKRLSRRSQVSVEFMMIIAISMMILLPGIYLFRNYVFESNDQILTSRLDNIADMILLKAKKMHYYGPPSKSTIQIDMPPQIGNMYILSNPDNLDNAEYYLMFTLLSSRGPEQVSYYSDVPLKAKETAPCGEDICIDTGCDYYECMPPRYYSKGLINIQTISSTECNFGEEFCVIIGDFSPN